MFGINNITQSDLTWRVFFFFMFTLFLESMYAYFFWSLPFVIPAIVSVYSLIFVVINPHYFNFCRKNLIPFFLFFLTMLYTKRDQNIFGYIGGVLPFIPIFLFFTLKLYYKAKFLSLLTKVLAVILFISLLSWLLVTFGVRLPYTMISYNMDGETYFLKSYFTFIEYDFISLGFKRFMSIFIEPGYLGALLAIMLYINNFELRRKEVLILFFSLICSFSLAGYLMLFVAYISYVLRYNKRAAGSLMLILVLIILSVNLAVKLNNGENMLNQLIIERMEISNDGKLSGYNRTNDEMDRMFVDFLKSKDLVYGIGQRYVQFGANVGYKPFIIINGILGLILLLLSYLSGWLYNKRVFTLTISILYIMIFSKGHSEIFWAGYLMIYAISIYLPENWREVYIK